MIKNYVANHKAGNPTDENMALINQYSLRELSKDEVLVCVDILRNSGRHISGKLYEQLLDKLEE